MDGNSWREASTVKHSECCGFVHRDRKYVITVMQHIILTVYYNITDVILMFDISHYNIIGDNIDVLQSFTKL